MTLRRWVDDEWWPGKQHLRPTTLAQYRWLLDKLVLAELGDRPLDRIDARVVARWRSQLLTRPGLSASTVAKAYRVLRQALAAAVEARYLAVNPATIKGAAVEPRPELVVPTIDEALALAGAMPEALRLLVLLYGSLGCDWVRFRRCAAGTSTCCIGRCRSRRRCPRCAG